MAKRPRTTYHHGDLRRALLDAATAIVDEEGPQAVTFRACARRAGVSHAAPAHHVGDLQGLTTALAVRYHEEFAAALELAASHPGTPADRLKALGLAYLGFATRHPRRFALMLRCEPGAEDAELRHAKARAAAPLLAVVAACRGRPIADDPAVLLAWSCVHGLAGLIANGVIHPQSFAPGGQAEPGAVMDLLVAALDVASVARLPASNPPGE